MVERIGHRKFYERALEIFMEEYRRSIEERGEFTVALSGGDTPKPLFKLLAKADIEWRRVYIFMVDERYLPPEDPESNYGNLWRTLLSRIEIPSGNIRYVKHFESLEKSKREYEFEVEKFFRKHGRGFDLILLGMGEDGHTASLFPDNIDLPGRVVPSVECDYHRYSRISLGIDTINRCRKKVFLLTRKKEEILIKVLEGGYPASRVEGNVTYLLEE